MGAIHTVGPNKCLVVSGGCCGAQQHKKYIIGGWGWAWCCVSHVQYLPLETMTVQPHGDGILSIEGVPLNVTAVAQFKINSNDESLEKAAEQFLERSQGEIKNSVLQTLEGHLRAILGILTVEEIYQDRKKFAQMVCEVAAPDVIKMGIDIVSFTIKEVNDDVIYLGSLGNTQTAIVKRDAAIGVAEANRDAGIREAECEKEAADIKFKADAQIAEGLMRYKIKQADFDMEINTKVADAELAYSLQEAILQQKIRAEEMMIDVVERRKNISVEDKEIIRKEKELHATVKLPAEADAYRITKLAEARRYEAVANAQAEAEKVRLIGEAEAAAIESVGTAQAEGMRLKASAYKQYGNAALISIVLKSLPQIAAEVSAPLSRVDEIVMVGDDRMTSEVSKLVSQLPPAVKALTGVDLSQVIAKIPGAKS